MTTLEDLRNRIGDHPVTSQESQSGDGDSTQYKLKYGGVQNYEVYVGGSLKTEGTDYEIDTKSGVVTFDTAPSDTVEVLINYQYAAFTDAELDDILNTQGGNVNGATLYCIDALMAEASRRFSYTQGQTTMNANEVFEQLKALREIHASGRSSSVGKIVRRKSPYYDRNSRGDISEPDFGGATRIQDISRIK